MEARSTRQQGQPLHGSHPPASGGRRRRRKDAAGGASAARSDTGPSSAVLSRDRPRSVHKHVQTTPPLAPPMPLLPPGIALVCHRAAQTDGPGWRPHAPRPLPQPQQFRSPLHLHRSASADAVSRAASLIERRIAAHRPPDRHEDVGLSWATQELTKAIDSIEIGPGATSAAVLERSGSSAVSAASVQRLVGPGSGDRRDQIPSLLNYALVSALVFLHGRPWPHPVPAHGGLRFTLGLRARPGGRCTNEADLGGPSRSSFSRTCPLAAGLKLARLRVPRTPAPGTTASSSQEEGSEDQGAAAAAGDWEAEGLDQQQQQFQRQGLVFGMPAAGHVMVHPYPVHPYQLCCVQPAVAGLPQPVLLPVYPAGGSCWDPRARCAALLAALPLPLSRCPASAPSR